MFTENCSNHNTSQYNLKKKSIFISSYYLGFSGGKVEVFFLLTSTYAFITTSIFTILILISNSYEKSLNIGNFVSSQINNAILFYSI